MHPRRMAVRGCAATQAANPSAARRAPRPTTTAVSRSRTTTAVPGLYALAFRAVLDPAAAAGTAGAVKYLTTRVIPTLNRVSDSTR